MQPNKFLGEAAKAPEITFTHFYLNYFKLFKKLNILKVL